MKKRLLSILFTLAVCLGLLSVTALAEDTVDYGVSVNGTSVTSANADNVLGDGKVSYDADTNTLTITGTLSGGTNSITGNGATDVVIDGGSGPAVAGGSFTVTGAKDVTVTANSSMAISNATYEYYLLRQCEDHQQQRLGCVWPADRQWCEGRHGHHERQLPHEYHQWQYGHYLFR